MWGISCTKERVAEFLWGDLSRSILIYSTPFHSISMTSSNGNIFRVTGLCAGNSPVTGEFPAQRPVTRSFDVSFDLRLNKRLSKQSWCWWFETPSRPLWRHCNDYSSIWYEKRMTVATPNKRRCTWISVSIDCGGKWCEIHVNKLRWTNGFN